MANDSIEATVEGLDEEGRGTFSNQGSLVRVPGACVGDRIKVQIISRSRHRPEAFAEVREVISRGLQFCEPLCPWAYPVRGRCGGCPAMHLCPDVQHQLKTSLVERALELHGLTAAVRFSPAPEPFGYRCRATYVVERRRAAVRLGSYAPRSHDVVRMDGCLVVRPSIARVAAELAHLLAERKVPIFPEPDGLRYVAIRASAERQVVVELVARTQAAAAWAGPLAQEVVGSGLVVGMSLSVNERDTDAIRVAPAVCLAGRGSVSDQVGVVPIELEAGSFSQLNLEVAQSMYRRAADFAGGASTLWDLYAGSGGLGLTVASLGSAGRIFGCDSVEEPLVAAAAAARALRLDATYEAVNLSLGVPMSFPAPDVALVNPPRRGLDLAVVDRLCEIGAPVIVYMSCHPGTFARDAAAFVAAGYRLTDLEAHDMLPQTTHVELLARLAR